MQKKGKSDFQQNSKINFEFKTRKEFLLNNKKQKQKTK